MTPLSCTRSRVPAMPPRVDPRIVLTAAPGEERASLRCPPRAHMRALAAAARAVACRLAHQAKLADLAPPPQRAPCRGARTDTGRAPSRDIRRPPKRPASHAYNRVAKHHTADLGPGNRLPAPGDQAAAQFAVACWGNAAVQVGGSRDLRCGDDRAIHFVLDVEPY